MLPGHGSRPVRRSVVHHDDLARPRGLGENGGQQAGQVRLLVSGRNDDGETPRRGRRRAVVLLYPGEAAAPVNKPAQDKPTRTRKDQCDRGQCQGLSHSTTCLATFWPQRTTMGMPPPGFTEPPTKKRFG